MIKKYIKGNKERGTEVIKALEELGGINKRNYNGECKKLLYFINKDGNIETEALCTRTAAILIECFEEIKLTEKPYKVKIKESKPIYWFKATEDEAKNQALLDKLSELSGHSDISLMTSRKSCIYFNECDKIVCYDIDNKLSRIAMMIGKELVMNNNEI